MQGWADKARFLRDTHLCRCCAASVLLPDLMDVTIRCPHPLVLQLPLKPVSGFEVVMPVTPVCLSLPQCCLRL